MTAPLVRRPHFGIVAVCLLLVHSCLAREFLFVRTSSPYALRARYQEAFKREFEPRMFPHATWHERLEYGVFEPASDETLETYSAADGSRRICHRTATPSISRVVDRRFWLGEHFDMRRKLRAIRVTAREVQLPPDAARELRLLWRTMLPGLPKAPTPQHFVSHVPYYSAMARDGQSIVSGEVAIAAYGTPAYRLFARIVGDLARACDDNARTSDPIFIRLATDMRRLREQL